MPVEGPRLEHTPTKTIEGSEISAFKEITIDDTAPTELTNIWWSAYNAGISFENVGNYSRVQYGLEVAHPLYIAVARYTDSNGQIQTRDFTAVTKGKRCLFTGSNTGFFMHNPAWKGLDTDFYVIGVDQWELQRDIRKNIAIYHELEHAVLADLGYDVQLLTASAQNSDEKLPPVAKIQAYSRRMRTALEGSRFSVNKIGQSQITPELLFALMEADFDIDSNMRLFHERNAWAGGIRLQKEHQFPSGFRSKLSTLTYAQFCLETYARAYSDNSFTHGVRE